MFVLLFCSVILSTTTAAVVRSNVHLNSSYHGLKAHKIAAVWDEAERICRSEGGYLASPISGDILKDMQHFFDANRQDNRYFIGTRARQVPGQYVSIEGMALEDMPVFDMLEQLNPDEGDCLTIDNQKISVVPCRTPLPYICHLNQTMSNNTTIWNVTKEHGCTTEGYQYIVSTDRCYKYYDVTKDWQSAEATCVADGAHLVLANDNDEARAIFDMRSKENNLWTGLQDEAGTGDWKSVDGIPVEQLYNVWYSGSKTTDGVWRCGYMRYDTGKLYSYLCDYGFRFICEKGPEYEAISYKTTNIMYMNKM